MASWLINNAGTIVITIILLAVVTVIIYSMIKAKKQGKSHCGGNCAHCKMCASCHTDENKQ